MLAPLERRAAGVYFATTMNAPNIAIVGATGAVGIEILRVLERRNFPVASLKLLASARSVGKTLEFKGKAYKVEELKADSFKGIDIAFFSAGATRSREFAPAARAAGCDRDRQLVGLPHGPQGAAGGARGERAATSRATTASSPTRTAPRPSSPRRGVADPSGRRHQARSSCRPTRRPRARARRPCRSSRTRCATTPPARKSRARSSRTRSPSTSSRTTPRWPRTATTRKRTR